jgi:TonB family protein
MAFLWGSVAAWVHLGLGVGAYEVGVTHEDHNALLTFADHVSTKIDKRGGPIEISFENVQATSPPIQTPPPPEVKLDKKDQKPPPIAKKEADKPKPQPEPEKKVAVVEKKPLQEEKKPTPPLPQVHPDKRIAVRQHVTPNQDDNPEAHFIGNEANRVKEEQAAQLTSHDRDDENPTPAKNRTGNEPDKGDSEKTRIAEADEHLGEENKGPGERGLELELQHDPRPVDSNGQQKGPKDPNQVRAGGDGQRANQETPPDLAPGNMAPNVPNVESADGSHWTFNIARLQGAGDNQQTGPGTLSRVLQPPSTTTERAIGLGGNPGPGQVNLNLDNRGVVAAVGADELRREREADGERRRSEHRGVWASSNFDRWRSAIENYVSSVKPGNQTALNTAAVPFATYLNAMHNRIHPIFADSFLASLDSLPATHVLNDQHLITRLEIVLTRDGHLVKMGVVKTSGVTAFDIAALDSVQRASPFGQAPGAIISRDGQVYLHWEFHRDEVYACSTMNARPFMLNSDPVEEKQPGPVNPPPNGPHERTLPTDTRQGFLLDGGFAPKPPS